MKYYNCHTHIFTLKNVPKRFIAIPTTLITTHGFGKALADVLRKVNPFDDEDMIERYANFLEAGNQENQSKVFDELRNYYLGEVGFVVLSMDMAYMGAGKVQQSFEEQLNELAELKKTHGDRIIPFVFADPRRPNVLNIVKDCIENKGFGGIKLYPALGYYPFDERLDGVYKYAQDNDLPLMTHTSKGGVFYKGDLKDEDFIHPKTKEALPRVKNKKFASNYGEPSNYEYVLQKYPNLKICFGHFGGANEWFDYKNYPEHRPKNWFYQVQQLIKKYPKVYTDISYTAAAKMTPHDKDNLDTVLIDMLKECLQDNELKERILFGSDYYMTNIEGDEYRSSSKLPQALGDLFLQIAKTNAEKYLFKSVS